MLAARVCHKKKKEKKKKKRLPLKIIKKRANFPIGIDEEKETADRAGTARDKGEPTTTTTTTVEEEKRNSIRVLAAGRSNTQPSSLGPRQHNILLL